MLYSHRLAVAELVPLIVMLLLDTGVAVTETVGAARSMDVSVIVPDTSIDPRRYPLVPYSTKSASMETDLLPSEL